MLYMMPQSMYFFRNDAMAIIVGIYYFSFIRRYCGLKYLVQIFKYAMPFLFLMCFISKGGSIKYGFVLPFMTLWNLLIPCLISIAIIKRNNILEQKTILTVTLICMIYVSVTTLLAVEVDPNIMRKLTSDFTEDSVMMMRMKGVGGYGTAYSMGAFMVSLWILYKKMNLTFFKRVCYIALMGYVAMFILRAQFTTLIFITIFGIFFYYLLDANTASKKIRLILLLAVILFSLQAIIHIGISLFEGQTIGGKFETIYEAIWRTGNLEQISSDRSEFQMNSIRLFMESPIWGNDINNQENSITYGASHSTLLSVLCATGLIGLLSYVKSFYEAIKIEWLSLCPWVNKSLFFSVVAYFAFFAFFNPADYSLEASWMVFVTVPLMNKLLNNKR